MKPFKIGILAGMGPASTGPFIDLVYQACRDLYGARNDGDFPKLIICSQPVPFHHVDAIDHDAIKSATIEGLRDLECAGCGVVGMACNSVHEYYPDLSASIGTPLLNIVDLALDALPSSARRIAFAASRPLARSQLYQNAARAKGFEVIDPDWQGEIDTLQDLVKVKTPEVLFAEAWSALFDRLPSERPVDCVVIACLDLSGVFRFADPPVPALDSAVQLADALVRRWHEEERAGVGTSGIDAANHRHLISS